MKITEVCGFSTDSIIAFGDDYADIVIGSNDEDGISDFIENKKNALEL